MHNAANADASFVPRPRAFLVGAPRCGTSALAAALSHHPDLFVPYVKEPHYFGSDLSVRRGFIDLPEYLSLFASAGDRLALEASTWYLFSHRAAQEIHAFDPDAHIIVMVRNPVDLMYSWHARAVLVGEEPIADFAEALAAEPDRRAGRRIPTGVPREHLLYRSLPRFSEQLERYLATFDRSRVHVIVHEHFKQDHAGTMRDVLSFLGVDSSYVPPVAVLNANAQVRNRVLQRAVEDQPETVRAIVRALVPRRVRHEVRRLVSSANRAPRARRPMDPELRAARTEEFAPEAERLGEMLGLDLSMWRGDTTATRAP